MLHVLLKLIVRAVGLGSGISGLASPLLITELAHPRERGKVTALYKSVVDRAEHAAFELISA